MAHKTFISYKYSEARELRDKIIDSLGQDASYYKGETADSPDLTDRKTETIKQHLKDMLFDTTVTIVIVSPNMRQSNWIDWEIEYSLCNYNRSGKCSSTNGVIGVLMKVNGRYDWIRSQTSHPDGCTSIGYSSSLLPDIMQGNRYNQVPKEYTCSQCKTIDRLTGSYISLVDEDEFLASPKRFVENAYEKSQNLWNYDICKHR